jgi:hypothetical protein
MERMFERHPSTVLVAMVAVPTLTFLAELVILAVAG